jgi:hypothetical protein
MMRVMAGCCYTVTIGSDPIRAKIAASMVLPAMMWKLWYHHVFAVRAFSDQIELVLPPCHCERSEANSMWSRGCFAALTGKKLRNSSRSAQTGKILSSSRVGRPVGAELAMTEDARINQIGTRANAAPLGLNPAISHRTTPIPPAHQAIIRRPPPRSPS